MAEDMAENEEEPESADDDSGSDVILDDEDDGAGEDEDFDFGDDEFADDDDEGLSFDRKRLLIFGGSGLAGVVAIIVISLLIFSGGDGEEKAEPEEESGTPRVVMKLPPKSGSLRALLSPPAAQLRAAGGNTKAATKGPQTLNAIGAATGVASAGLVVPSVTTASFADVPSRQKDKPLSAAPDPALVEKTGEGQLPKIAADGRQAWQVYARPYSAPQGVPRVAIIVTGLGLSRAATQAAIERLPAAVTLAFHPNGSDLANWIDQARRAGHEVLMSVPMEPEDFPASDPGPLTLQTDAELQQNMERLNRVLGRATGYVGVLEVTGTKFVRSEESLKPVLDVIKRRGLLYVDGGSASDSRAPRVARELGLPNTTNEIKIDSIASGKAINARLGELEADARRRSVVVATAEPLPVTLSRLAAWISTLPQKRISLAPVSAVVQTPPQPPAAEK